jgi:hypothetical protein
MKGEFRNTIILMMGCEGLGYEELTYTDMAEAFVKKGAKAYISWDGTVGINHTDKATVQLLQSLIGNKRTISEALTQTMETVGKDPAYNSTLQYYPKTAEAGNHTIPNLNSSSLMNVILASLISKAPTKTKSTARG